MNNLEISTKFDLQYSESKIFFSISDCSLDRKYSFWCLDKEQAKKFINKLKHIEKLTWGQFANLERKKGLTVEKKDSKNFELIGEQNTSESKLVEQYYFHFRIEQTGLFRVFGYQRNQVFYITHIDPNGKVNH